MMILRHPESTVAGVELKLFTRGADKNGAAGTIAGGEGLLREGVTLICFGSKSVRPGASLIRLRNNCICL